MKTKTNAQRKTSASAPQRAEKGTGQRRVILFPINLGGQADSEPSRIDRIEELLKSVMSERYADKQPGNPAQPADNRNGCLDAGRTFATTALTPTPPQPGIMQSASDVLNRLGVLAARFGTIRNVLRRVPTSESRGSEPKPSHEDLSQIRNGQYEHLLTLENLVYEIESELGI